MVIFNLFISLTALTWIYGYLKQADMNHDGTMSYEEVQTLFKMINIDLSEENAASLFKVSLYYLAALENQKSLTFNFMNVFPITIT